MLDGVATVKVVVDGGKVAHIPFNAEQFKAVVESVRREVIAAISTEQAWARRHSICRVVAVVVTQAVTAINGQATIRRAATGQR